MNLTNEEVFGWGLYPPQPRLRQAIGRCWSALEGELMISGVVRRQKIALYLVNALLPVAIARKGKRPQSEWVAHGIRPSDSKSVKPMRYFRPSTV